MEFRIREYLILSHKLSSDIPIASFNTFASGKEAADNIRFNDSLSGKYKVVEGDGSLDRGIGKMF